MKIKILYLVSALALFLSSCVTTNITGVWEDDTFVVAPVKKIMVIGMFREDRIRKIVENELVNSINKNGTGAFPSYKVFELEKVKDKEFLAAKINETKVESILIIRAIDREATGSYTPGEIYDNPPSNYLHLYEYAKNAHSSIIGVEYASPFDRRNQTMKAETFTAETNIYSAETKNLAVTIASDTELIRRTEKVVENLATTVVKKLQEINIIL